VQENTESTLVLGRKPISAASSFSVRDRDFQLRPIGSVQDILRVTPGLVLVQHSGGGKANQYFLRGFDADHGTDLALSIDGIPINMVSHAHGQGFSDTNFIIPETVERVEITKGPYFANQGDFATAGAVNLVSRDNFEHSSLGFGAGGSPGHGAPSYRGLLVASPTWDHVDALGGMGVKTTFAAEIGRQNGPFDNPENWDKYKLWNKVTLQISSTSTLSIGESSYAGNWHGSGQIPARAVDQGLVSRFGSIDPNEGGNTARHQVFAAYKVRPSDHSEVTALAYVGSYRFNLFSNFTLYLNDPNNGDEIEQIDRRTFYGGKVSYRIVHELHGVKFDTTIGADTRSDDIHEELWHTAARTQLDQTRGNDVHETFVGAYANEEISPAKWLRFNVGGRADVLSFSVDNRLQSTDPQNPRSGVDAANQLSPKASAIVTPLAEQNYDLDFYANYGEGFHSNDVRGAFTTPAVTPLTRARGEEVGARTRLFRKLDFATAFWNLDLANETTWNGDDGTTNVGGATNRYGVELEARYEILSWLAADGDVTFTHSQFTADHENGGGLALAPKQTWSGGLSARHAIASIPGTFRGGLRLYGIGDRPASDDGQIVAPGFTQFDLHAGYRHRRFDLALDIENLFNQDFRSAQFDTVSRLRTEPGIGTPVPAGFTCGKNARLAPTPSGGPSNGAFYGCEDVNFTPAYPFTARLMATVFLD
jgi:outer membrane receptor protein involved in Fe transport